MSDAVQQQQHQTRVDGRYKREEEKRRRRELRDTMATRDKTDKKRAQGEATQCCCSITIGDIREREKEKKRGERKERVAGGR